MKPFTIAKSGMYLDVAGYTICASHGPEAKSFAERKMQDEVRRELIAFLAASPLMYKALVRIHDNITRWLATEQPAGPEESRAIYEEIAAALQAAGNPTDLLQRISEYAERQCQSPEQQGTKTMTVKLSRIQRPLSSLESMCPDGCKDIEYYSGHVFDSIVKNLITVIKYKKQSDQKSEYEKLIAVQVFRLDEVYGTQFREPTEKEIAEILDFVGGNSVEKVGSSDDGIVHLYRLINEYAERQCQSPERQDTPPRTGSNR